MQPAQKRCMHSVATGSRRMLRQIGQRSSIGLAHSALSRFDPAIVVMEAWACRVDVAFLAGGEPRPPH
eukprot:scaffold115671_cov30-Phaeocystis_antarctica.AAC.1